MKLNLAFGLLFGGLASRTSAFPTESTVQGLGNTDINDATCSDCFTYYLKCAEQCPGNDNWICQAVCIWGTCELVDATCHTVCGWTSCPSAGSAAVISGREPDALSHVMHEVAGHELQNASKPNNVTICTECLADVVLCIEKGLFGFESCYEGICKNSTCHDACDIKWPCPTLTHRDNICDDYTHQYDLCLAENPDAGPGWEFHCQQSFCMQSKIAESCGFHCPPPIGELDLNQRYATVTCDDLCYEYKECIDTGLNGLSCYQAVCYGDPDLCNQCGLHPPH